MGTNGLGYPIWYPLSVLAALLFASAMLSIRSGWRKIAKRFPHKRSAVGRKFFFVRMTLGRGLNPAGYGGAVSVRVSTQGLGLSVFFLLRFYHPPMFIPWSEVTRCYRGQVRFYDVTSLSIRDEESEFTFFGKSGEYIHDMFRSARSGGSSGNQRPKEIPTSSST